MRTFLKKVYYVKETCFCVPPTIRSKFYQRYLDTSGGNILGLFNKSIHLLSKNEMFQFFNYTATFPLRHDSIVHQDDNEISKEQQLDLTIEDTLACQNE